MKLPAKLKIFFLLVGDIVVLYCSLIVALLIRYGGKFESQFLDNHVGPFSIIFPAWLAVFYIAGLYDLAKLRNNLEFLKTLLFAIFISALLTIAAFYLIPAFGITPKTNLLIFAIVFVVVESVWRRTWNLRASFREGLAKIILLDNSPRAKEIFEELKQNPQIGYDVRLWIKDGLTHPGSQNFQGLIKEHGINLVVVPAHLKHDETTARTLYELLGLGLEIKDVPSFYEMVFRKVPIGDISESWFIDHAIGERKFYDDLKRGLEVAAAILLALVLSPLLAVIAIGIKISSPGPIIFKQVRVGKHGREFKFYKFRSMPALSADGSAETKGPQWAAFKDKRATPFGQLLRVTHLDELPQLLNILNGDLSFVGPRPERPEFVTILREQVRFYDARHLVTPGITGWAQINYRKDETTADVEEKIKYDLYYLKNRSLILDLAIVLKTIKSLLINPQ